MPPAFSVVVVSQGRPAALRRCVRALCQLYYRPYEIVVVADEAGQAALGDLAARPYLRVVPNEAPGVAAARNLGISHSGGELVAFIDDDAVPEPTWLDHLSDAFADPGTGAATGAVRGRNGISFQWRARLIRPDGHTDPLSFPGNTPGVPERAGDAVMLEGTNMAIRKSILHSLGGFDSAYRFLLDDADMAMRLSVSGARTAIVPLAEVHHGFAASTRRRADRMPRDLFDNGRSLAIFLRKHASDRAIGECLEGHREGERRRLLRYMVDGRGEPRDVRRLLARFDAGARDGLDTPRLDLPDAKSGPVSAVFRTDRPPSPPAVFFGRARSRGDIGRRAKAVADKGGVASVFCFSPTALYHRVQYLPDGYWEQTGGVFGRSERDMPLIQATSFASRLRREVERVALQRGIREVGPYKP